jgi:hypothetical protein
MYRKNTANQYIYFALVNATTGAALTGATVTGKRAIDGAAQAAVTGTIAEDAGGQYHLTTSAADTNGNNVGFLFTATNAIPVSICVVTTAADPTNATSFGLTDLDATISSRMATFTLPANFSALAIDSSGRLILQSTGLNQILVDGKTLPVAVQYIAASTAGKVSGAGSGTEIFLGLDAVTTRLTVTVDSAGNRTAITYG